ncbi:hypothetical protein E2C01_002914 [Portunus trituberculatus]|uniref:Uncharacterized protein n=1 Tax=Portunus trituberculatus TaxID=210409 RepID=A0A5B7CKR2_PORTR|nr:hypothetical protein [Portunus trituberculatus]
MESRQLSGSQLSTVQCTIYYGTRLEVVLEVALHGHGRPNYNRCSPAHDTGVTMTAVFDASPLANLHNISVVTLADPPRVEAGE